MKILVIEGMFPWLHLVENQLVKPMLAKFPGLFTYTARAWSDSLPFATPDIVIGHSLGGDAAIKFCAGKQVKCLITLDPRHMSNWSWLDFMVTVTSQGNFKAPIAKIFNFLHEPPVLLPGCMVDGAIMNTKLETTHFTLPGHPEVASLLKSILAGLA